MLFEEMNHKHCHSVTNTLPNILDRFLTLLKERLQNHFSPVPQE